MALGLGTGNFANLTNKAAQGWGLDVPWGRLPPQGGWDLEVRRSSKPYREARLLGELPIRMSW
jgi:hypothetical protein